MNGKTELRFRIAFGATLLASATMAATTWNVSPELTDGMTGAQQFTNAVIRAANGDTVALAAGTPDWFVHGRRPPSGRIAFSTARPWTKAAPLAPAGLEGPVELKTTSRECVFERMP